MRTDIKINRKKCSTLVTSKIDFVKILIKLMHLWQADLELKKKGTKNTTNLHSSQKHKGVLTFHSQYHIHINRNKEKMYYNKRKHFSSTSLHDK